jgi:hypothetical protein
MTQEETAEFIRRSIQERTEEEDRVRVWEIGYIIICAVIIATASTIVWKQEQSRIQHEEDCRSKGSWAAKDPDGNYLCVKIRND